MNRPELLELAVSTATYWVNENSGLTEDEYKELRRDFKTDDLRIGELARRIIRETASWLEMEHRQGGACEDQD